MPTKIFRDPLYNYISIDVGRDRWLLELIDCPEVQRLRRIHQLGVSNFTYPGAEHSRLSHSLGVLHLMQAAVEHLERTFNDEQVKQARAPLLAAAVLHDVGHGPFSHLFEPCLSIDHEHWSREIILCPDSPCNKVLKSVTRSLPQTVADLIDPSNQDHPSWMNYLISSQLDMDRLDYLRRDSLFTGAGYGHFDWYRIVASLELDGERSNRNIVWPEKSIMAVEEYVFSRYYMYQNVYLHKTTRGFEKIVEAMWKRAGSLKERGADVDLVPSIASFWKTDNPAPAQYLAIEEFTVLQQIQNWSDHADKALADLARRFLFRDHFVMIEPPRALVEREMHRYGEPDYSAWESALKDVLSEEGFAQDEYCLKDAVKRKYHQPYFPEKEGDEQSAKNAIRIRVHNEAQPIEISQLRPRLQPLVQEAAPLTRYYIPKQAQSGAKALRDSWQL